MAAVARRWRTPFLAGILIWLVSFPLTTGQPVPGAGRGVALTVVGVDVDSGIAPRRQAARPPRALVIGELRRPSPPPASAVSNPDGPATPALRPNWLYIPRLGLGQPVGWYGDCLGRAPVPRWGAWRWSCAGANNIYVMAHNPGVFTPILALRAGDLLDYDDPGGRVHTYRVSFTTVVSNTQLWPLGATPAPSLTLQTCWTWDGSRDFIVRAVQN